jgi:hypothetical protein
VEENDQVRKLPLGSKDIWWQGTNFVRHRMAFNPPIINASMAIIKKQAALKAGNEWVNFFQAGDFLFFNRVAEQGKVFESGAAKAFFVRHSEATSEKRMYGIEACKEMLFAWEYLLQKDLINHIVIYDIDKSIFQPLQVTGVVAELMQFSKAQGLGITKWHVFWEEFRRKLMHFIRVGLKGSS